MSKEKIIVNATENTEINMPGLETKINPSRACKNPVIFIPGIKNKINYIDTEPYTGIVRECMVDYTLAFNNDGVSSSNYVSQYLFNRFMDISMTNINIIFNSSILGFIKRFNKPAREKLLFDTYSKYSIFNEPNFRQSVRTALAENFSNMEDRVEFFARGITEIKALYSVKLAQWLYNFINEIVMNGYVDTVSMGRYMVFGDMDLNSVNPEKLNSINVSLHAVCIDGLLEIATSDITKATEILEPLFVNLYYSFMDYNLSTMNNKIEEK